MKETSHESRTAPSVALSRREFMRGAGGVALALTLSIHDGGVAAAPPASPPRFSAAGGRPAGRVSATVGDLFQLPFWNDAGSWSDPEYYETIQAGRRPFPKTFQTADIDGDGRDELLARGPNGVLASKFSPDLGQWLPLPDGPAWDDAGSWGKPQYSQTFQTADLDGDGQAEVLIRSSEFIFAYKYNPASGLWQPLPAGPSLPDSQNWDQPQYYQTIQCADIDGDGADELLARGPNGIIAFKYNPVSGAWASLPDGPNFSDAFNWNLPPYYTTIQCADIDGDGAAEVLGRGATAVFAFKYTTANGWIQLANGPDWSDDNGWNAPWAYATIQCADIDGDGAAELLGLSPDPQDPSVTVGPVFWKYSAGAWAELPPLPEWFLIGPSDPGFPDYATIQCAAINVDGRADLLVRDQTGLRMFDYDPNAQQWNRLVPLSAWSDANNWNQVQYSSTIQTARTLLPGDRGYTGDGTHPQALLLGRATVGMQTYRYDTPSQSWQNPTAPLPTFTGDALAAYDYITTALNIQGTLGNGIRARYNDLSANLQGWINDLLGTGVNPVTPPPNNPEWEAVKTQILNELTWVMDVQKWYGNLSVQQINSTFLSEDLTLYTVGQLLNYANSDTTSLLLSIEALLTRVAAAVASLAGPEVSAAITVISTIFAAAAQFAPNGGDSFTSHYNELQGQLTNAFNAAITNLGALLTAITGGLNNGVYTPADYGLLKSIGQLIESTVWSWPASNLQLTAVMQRAYALEIFKVLFEAYEANANQYHYWLQVEDENPTYTPPGYPVPNALYTVAQPYRWISLYYNVFDYPPTDTLQNVFNPVQEGSLFPLGANAPDFYLAQNGWPQIELYQTNRGSAPPTRAKPPRPTLGPNLSVKATLSRDPATREIIAALTLKNKGVAAATNVEIVATTLNRRRQTVGAPPRRTRLSQGRSHRCIVRFPPLAQGETALLKVSGRHRGGSFGGSFRLKIP